MVTYVLNREKLKQLLLKLVKRLSVINRRIEYFKGYGKIEHLLMQLKINLDLNKKILLNL
jgi:hypothetical protein